jgi:hypothetical protein
VRGRTSPFFYLAILCGLLLPAVLGMPRSRPLKITKALLTLGGGYLLRAAIILAGHESGRNPQAYFRFTDPAGAVNRDE